MHYRYRSSGFTLIELLVTLVVLAIVVTVAVPSFQDIIRNNRVSTETNSFVSALQLARSEAVKQGAEVSLTANIVNQGFASGYCVYVGGAGVNCSNANRIRQFDPLNSSLSSTTTQLTFNGMGELVANASITVNVAPPDCPSGKEGGMQQVTIGLGGQIIVSREECL